MKFKLLFAITFITSNIVYSQPAQQWVVSYNGTANSVDYGRALRIDNTGNAYIAGTVSYISTAKDIAVIKYNSQGVQQWVATYNGTANLDDWGYGLVIDSAENVYVAGFTGTSASGKDFITIKFDSSGIFLWARQYNGPANFDDAANHIAIDPWGNVIVTGPSKGTGTSDDYATVKYSLGGTQLWVQRYDGPASGIDDARTITTDKWGSIYVSGGSTGIGSDYDFCTIKYDSAGTQKWVARYNGPNNAYDLVYYQGSVIADTLGNVYITGYSKGLDSSLDYATIKYDSLGNQLWVSRFFTDSAGTDYADAIYVDDSLNVYVTGGSYKTPNNYDFATVKYNMQGIQQWVSYYNGTANGWDEAYSVLTDDSMNVYIVGRSTGTGSGDDFVTIKYSSSGNQTWTIRYNNSGFDWPFNIRLYNNDCIYVGGNLGAPSFSDIGIIKYCQASLNTPEIGIKKNELKIFPNPSNGSFTIESKENNYLISISNIIGQKIYSSKIDSNKAEIDLGKELNGIYFITIKTEQGTANNKIIINK